MSTETNSNSDHESSATENNINLNVGDIALAPATVPQPLTSSSGHSAEDYESLQSKFHELQTKHRDATEESFDLRERLSVAERRQATSAILDDLIVPYAGKAFRYMVGYSVAVLLLLLISGLDVWWFKHFTLPDSTLDFLVGSTAATVIGLVGMVLTGIFLGARK